MTYLELYHLVTSEANVLIPMHGITSLTGLIWISEAMHQYQVETGVVRCVDDLTLDPDSTNGQYELSSDIDVIDKIAYYSNKNANPIPVNMADYDAFFRLQGQSVVTPITNQFQTAQSIPFYPSIPTNAILPGLQPSPYYVTRYGDCLLYIWPFQQLSGFLRIYYKPYMMPYTPYPTGRWQKFGHPPDGMMASEHIPREFQAAIEGIKGYCMTKVLQKIPNHTKIFPGAWQGYYQDFKDGPRKIMAKHPPMAQDIVPTPNMTGRVI